MAPVLRNLCDALNWSAASFIYRDFALDRADVGEFRRMLRHLYRSLLLALFHPRNTNAEVYMQLRKCVEDAIGRAMSRNLTHRELPLNEREWTKKRSARQFAHVSWS